MLTLTNAAEITKKIIILGIFIAILIGIIATAVSTVKKTVNSLKPPQPPQLTTIFGELPKITYPQQIFPTDIRFSLETLSGNIPSASPTAKVYFLPKKQKSLLTNIRANQDAKNLGIETAASTVNKKLVYQGNNKTFTIDPITRNFAYTYNYQNDPSVFSGTTNINQSSAVSVANNFLKTLDALPSDYSQNPTVTLLTYNGAQFIPLGKNEDPSLATAARVDYFRNKIDLLPVVTPEFNEGNIYVIVGKTNDKSKQVIEASRNYQEISNEDIGVYPIKSGDSAFEEFLNGDGYIANPGNSALTKRAVIRDSYIAYFDSGSDISYLMPVYVFIGDEGFVGYIQAIDNQWIQSN